MRRMLPLFFAVVLISAMFWSFRATADDTCATVDEVTASITRVPLLTKVEGAQLQSLKRDYPGTFPEALETLLIFGPRDGAIFTTVGFVNGCAQGIGHMSPNIALPLAGEPA